MTHSKLEYLNRTTGHSVSTYLFVRMKKEDPGRIYRPLLLVPFGLVDSMLAGVDRDTSHPTAACDLHPYYAHSVLKGKGEAKEAPVPVVRYSLNNALQLLARVSYSSAIVDLSEFGRCHVVARAWTSGKVELRLGLWVGGSE